MSKTKTILELINLLAIALRHKIGSMVNDKEIYAQKYAKDAEVLFNEARVISARMNLSHSDKLKIKEELRKKIYKELEEREFLNEKKFEIMESEMSKVLVEFGLLE